MDEQLDEEILNIPIYFPEAEHVLNASDGCSHDRLPVREISRQVVPHRFGHDLR